MSDVCYFLSSCHFLNVIPESWLVEFTHLLKRELPVVVTKLFFASVNVDPLVVSAVPISSRVIHPQVEALVDQHEAQTLLFVAYDARTAVCQAMLVYHDRFGLFKNLFPSFFNGLSTLAWDPIDCVDVAVLGIVDVLLERIPHLLCYKPPQRRNFEAGDQSILDTCHSLRDGVEIGNEIH